MRYLVTGGAGFIGSHLVDALVLRGDAVTVLDDLSTGSEENLRTHLDAGSVRLVTGSALDADLVAEVIAGCDHVFHLAATVGVKLVLDDPLRAMRNNILSTDIVLEAASAAGARILFTSTSEVYGENGSGKLSERHPRVAISPIRGRWAYAASKTVGEILAEEHWRHRGTATVVARLFNCSGPRQSDRYGMVLPTFVRQALAGRDLTVFGDGTQTRCFIHVEDAVGALLRLLDEDGATGQALNVGTEQEISIGELAERVIELTGSASRIARIPYEEAYQPGFDDMRRRVPDTSRIRDLLGWEPRHRLEDIILDVAVHERERMGASLP